MFSKLLCAAIVGTVVGQNDTTTTTVASSTNDTTTTVPAAAGPATTTTTTTPILLGTLEVTTTDVWNTSDISAGNQKPTVETMNDHADIAAGNDYQTTSNAYTYFNAKMSAMQAGITATMSGINTKTLVKEDMAFALGGGRRLSSHASATLNFVTKAAVKATPNQDVAAIAAAKVSVLAVVSNATSLAVFKNSFETEMTTKVAALATLGPAAVDVKPPPVAATSAAAPVVAGVSAVLAMLATLF